MIEIRGLGKAYPTRNAVFEALRGVDLEIAKGELFGIIGRSGAGKSTLLRMINLLERPTSGRILVEGVDVTDLDGEPLRRLRLRIAVVVAASCHPTESAGYREGGFMTYSASSRSTAPANSCRTCV